MPLRPRLGELLLQSRAVTPELLEQALRAQQQSGSRIGTQLIDLGVDEEVVGRALSSQFRVPLVDTPMLRGIPRPTLALLTPEQAHRYKAIPFRWKEHRVDIALMEPTNPQTLSDLANATGLAVTPFIASELHIEEALTRLYGPGEPKTITIDLHRQDRSIEPTPPEGFPQGGPFVAVVEEPKTLPQVLRPVTPHAATQSHATETIHPLSRKKMPSGELSNPLLPNPLSPPAPVSAKPKSHAELPNPLAFAAPTPSKPKSSADHPNPLSPQVPFSSTAQASVRPTKAAGLASSMGGDETWLESNLPTPSGIFSRASGIAVVRDRSRSGSNPISPGLAAQIARTPTSTKELPANVPPPLAECVLSLCAAERLTDVMEAALTFSAHYFEKSFVFRVHVASYSVLVAKAPLSARLKVEALALRSRQRTPFDALVPPSPFYLGPLSRGSEEDGLLQALEEDARAPIFLLPLVPMTSHHLLLLGAAPSANFSDGVLRQFTIVGEKVRLALHIQQLRKRQRAVPTDWS